MAVIVQKAFAPALLGGTGIVRHATGTHWRKTKKGTLIVYDANGLEVGRHKPQHWWIVGLEETKP